MQRPKPANGLQRLGLLLLMLAVLAVGAVWTAPEAEAASFDRGVGRPGGGIMRAHAPTVQARQPMFGAQMGAHRLAESRWSGHRLTRKNLGGHHLTDRRFATARRVNVIGKRRIGHLPPSSGETSPIRPTPPRRPGKGGGETRPRPHPHPFPPPPPPIVVGVPPVNPYVPVGPGYAPPTVVSAGPSAPSFVSGPPGNGGGGGGAFSGRPGFIAPATNDPRFVPDEVIVSFPAGIAPQSIVGLAQSQRLALLGIHRLALVNTALYRFRITDGRPVPQVVQSLGADARVGAVQPNYVYALQAEPQSVRTGDPAQYALDKLNVRAAHGVATGMGVLIAVIDSGIDATHPELSRAVVGAFDAARSPTPPNAHGTAMASAIVAHGKLLGVAPSARLLSVRAFDGAGGAAQSTTIRILDGLQWAADSGARIINMSFTGPADTRLREMVAAARARGLVLVAAAGNDGPRARAAYPAAYPEVIAVTATDQADVVFARANRGPYVALAAPGVDVFVALPNSGYTLTTGTSVAAALVSGLAALLLERNPALAPDQVQAILTASAKDLGPRGRDDLYGAGLADAYGALNLLAPRIAAQPLSQ